jgi:hypothetical protein
MVKADIRFTIGNACSRTEAAVQSGGEFDSNRYTADIWAGK